MNKDFDELIKSMINDEPDFISKEIKQKIKTTLESLPENDNGLKKQSKYRPKGKVLLIAAILIVMLTATVFAFPKIFKMTQNFIKQFYNIDNINLKSKQEEYEKYNSPANYTSESEGISVTIDNIAVDGNFLLITSTVTSPKTIKDMIAESSLYKQVLKSHKEILEKHKQALKQSFEIDYKDFIFTLSPYYLFKIDGNDDGVFDMPDWDEYIVNDYTFVTVQKYIIPTETPDIFNLSITSNNICNVKGNWNFDIIIDKGNAKENSVAVTPNINAEITSIVHGTEYKHNITIDKLSISPFGGQITLSERGDEIFRDFTLRDTNGKYYLVLNSTVKSSGKKEMSKNSFEFISPSEYKNLRELELVPILTYGTPVEKKVMLKDDVALIDIKISDIGGYKVDSMDINDNGIKLILKPYGAILQYRSIINGAFGFLDKEGSKEINKHISLDEVKYDKTNGNAIITGHWDNNDSYKVSEQIGGIWYVEMPSMKLNENEAVKIMLK